MEEAKEIGETVQKGVRSALESFPKTRPTRKIRLTKFYINGVASEDRNEWVKRGGKP